MATARSVALDRVDSQDGPSVGYWVAAYCVAEGGCWAVCKGLRPPFSPATPSVGGIQSLGAHLSSVFLLGLYPRKTAELIQNVGKTKETPVLAGRGDACTQDTVEAGRFL